MNCEKVVSAMKPLGLVSLTQAIGGAYLQMTVEELNQLEGNIGQLVIAQAVMYLKTHYRILEFQPKSEDQCLYAVKLCPNLRTAEREATSKRRL